MKDFKAFKDFLSINVIYLSKLIYFNIQGIRTSYPSRAFIYYSNKPFMNIQNIASYLKKEARNNNNNNGARSKFKQIFYLVF